MRFFAASTETRKCVNITILDDNIEEGNREETISVQVVSTDPPSLGIFPDASILSVSIMDSDSELHTAESAIGQHTLCQFLLPLCYAHLFPVSPIIHSQLPPTMLIIMLTF